ncbi:MAG: HAMP domain-containing protein [Deltaproteobacteria bacterium]|jgi:two-component system nitrogen regulation sensor histidine kinase NtrY|nr:HAMP domain-containing protein [Deltaproteobacteria bacterium]
MTRRDSQNPAPASAQPATARDNPSALELSRRSHKRRRRELLAAAAAFCLVLILTYIQFDHYRSGSGTAFVVLFNINVVLLGGILVVVLRNAFKLLLERRRRVMGSRLRSRLVLSFVVIALLPCLLMLLVTTKYVQLSMDFWFKIEVETTMETALGAARSSYEIHGEDAAQHVRTIQAEIAERGLAWGGRDMDLLLERKRLEYRLALLGVYELLPPVEDQADEPPAGRREQEGRTLIWHAVEDSAPAWISAAREQDWRSIRPGEIRQILASGERRDYLLIICQVRSRPGTFFVLAKDMGLAFQENLDRVSKGAGEYRNLRAIKRPLTLMLYSSLGVLTMLILLGAIWVGFRLAQELSAPVLALVDGTQRIARGDLSVRLDDPSSDELGLLIRSFNTMAEDLEESRKKIVDANVLLEERNLRIAGHSAYVETILNNIAAGVISFDDKGLISTANHAAGAILGLNAQAMVGRSAAEILPPAPPGRQARDLAPEMPVSGQNPESRSRYAALITVGGENRRLLITVVNFSADGVFRGSVAVFEDISELERIQRIAAWREVARRIAHEIKNPLTPIKLSAQRLARKFSREISDPAFVQGTGLIVREVERLQGMVQEFSAFAKLPEVRPRPDSIDSLLQAVTELFRNSHANIRWELDIPVPLPRFPMDREALHRAFLNIYMNAAEALEQSGAAAPTVRVSAVLLPSSGLVRIAVADNGPGFSAEELSRLFEPYFSRKKGGTGLGLVIVRSIVTDHGGYIRVLPREGGGTVLEMELPLA